jgi:hypothetical protein
MKKGTKAEIPTWARRVTQKEIRRLYETDAKGIYDEALIDEVGYGLLARCRSFIDAMDAIRGRARCPHCSSVVVHTSKKEELLHCDCGWELSWGEYFKTIQHQQLNGAVPVINQFRDFVNAFPIAKTLQEKVILIDILIHGFHWYYKSSAPARPVAVNLIEGKMNEVVAFLDSLSYGDKSSPGTRENYAQWNENIEVNRDWYSSRRKQAEQMPSFEK